MIDEELKRLNEEEIQSEQEYIDYNILQPQDITEMCDYDSKEFNKGYKYGSYYAGIIYALRNALMDNENIMNFILNIDTIALNQKLNTETTKSNVEIAKNQQVQIQNQQL